MKELDKVLSKHLPDDGLCKRGIMLNKQRKEQLKADLLNLIQKRWDRIEMTEAIAPPQSFIIIDETQLRV